MFYYKVKSSHWPMELEFGSKLTIEKDQCFRITSHNGRKSYPTRFKVVSVSDTPEYPGELVEILSISTDVEKF